MSPGQNLIRAREIPEHIPLIREIMAGGVRASCLSALPRPQEEDGLGAWDGASKERRGNDFLRGYALAMTTAHQQALVQVNTSTGVPRS